MEQVSTKSMRVWWPPGEAAANRFFDVLDRYSEPHRRYHNETHVMWVGTWCFWLCGQGVGADPAPVMLAALFHDAIYDPRAKDNEKRSAELARAELAAMDHDHAVIDEVARLVELTAHHRCEPDDLNASVLLDADLAVLGATRTAYEGYARDVRLEYHFLSDREWSAGRGLVLSEMLAQPRLFSTKVMYDRLEENARSNMAWELGSLRG